MIDDLSDDDILGLIDALRSAKAPHAAITEVLTAIGNAGFTITRGGGDLHDHSVGDLLAHIKKPVTEND